MEAAEVDREAHHPEPVVNEAEAEVDEALHLGGREEGGGVRVEMWEWGGGVWEWRGGRAWRKSAEMRMETTDPASRVGGVSGWWTYSISHSKMCTWRGGGWRRSRVTWREEEVGRREGAR